MDIARHRAIKRVACRSNAVAWVDDGVTVIVVDCESCIGAVSVGVWWGRSKRSFYR